jgi:hypothetical protein
VSLHSKAAGHAQNRRLCLSAPYERRGCRTGMQHSRSALRPPKACQERGTTRFDLAIISPAPHRTLITIKVPCSIALFDLAAIPVPHWARPPSIEFGDLPGFPRQHEKRLALGHFRAERDRLARSLFRG